MTLDDDDDGRETRGKACENVGACVIAYGKFQPSDISADFRQRLFVILSRTQDTCQHLMYDWPLSSNTTVTSPKVSIFFRIFDTNY